MPAPARRVLLSMRTDISGRSSRAGSSRAGDAGKRRRSARSRSASALALGQCDDLLGGLVHGGRWIDVRQGGLAEQGAALLVVGPVEAHDEGNALPVRP